MRVWNRLVTAGMATALVVSGAVVGLAGAASAATAPDAPTGLTAVAAGAHSVTLHWTAPVNTGGATLTGYNVYESTVSGSETSLPPINGGVLVTGTTLTVSTTNAGTALVTGTPYFFEVTAANTSSPPDSSVSNEATATPVVLVPGAPTGASATGYNATQATLNWTAPANIGGSAITGYTVTSSPAGLTCAPGTATTCLATGTTGVAYTFTVTATNTAGTGSASAPSNSVTLAIGAPSAPTGVGATAGNTSASVAWTPPANNGGSAILGYNVYEGTTAGGESATPINGGVLLAASPAIVNGLTNGTTYYFTVKAVNALGSSVASTEVSATPSLIPAGTPGAPTGASATGYNATQATLNWTAPANIGGSAITGYTVTSSPAGLTCAPGIATTCLATGTTGVAYTFTVTATNTAGTGSASAPSNSVTLAVVAPGAPTGVFTSGTTNSGTTVNWTPPANNGGLTILGYNVYEGTTPGGESATPINGTLITFGTNTFAVTPLSTLVTYYFTVKAISPAGFSAASNEATATPGISTSAAPTGLTATPASSTSLILNWTAPASQGSGPVTGYSVYEGTTPGGEDYTTPVVATVTNVNLVTVVAPATTATVAGLTPGTTYYFTVKATNSTLIGTPWTPAYVYSVASTEASGIPAGLPGAPTVPGVILGNGQATLSWTAPASNGSAITGYLITPSVGSPIITGNVTSYIVTGLTNGTPYTFTVAAINAIGTGTALAGFSATPAASVPGAPTGLTATPGNTSVTLSWTAPSNTGGSPILGYNVYESTTSGSYGSTPINGGVLITGTSVTVTTTNGTTALTNGTTYYFTVKAVNAVNSSGGAASGEASAIPTPGPTVPGAPTGVSAAAGSASAIVGWTAPASGGSAITGYIVTPYLNAVAQTPQTFTSTATIEVVTGLTAGGSYTFTVAAVNGIGTGTASGFSNFVTPTPTPPTPGVSILQPGGTLSQGQSLVSANGLYTAVLQPDGNFVVYGPTGAIWWTATNNSAQDTLVLQSDGNLVLYGPAGHPLWWTSTNPATATGLVMQNDGNLVLYGTSGALWSSKTGKL